MSFIKLGADSRSAATIRKDVKKGELFKVVGKGNSTVYAHMGTRTTPPSRGIRGGVGYQSLIVRSAKRGKVEENAVTYNGDSKVEIVGTFELVLNISDGA